MQEHWWGYLRARWLEHLQGKRFWVELDRGDFGLLQREFHDQPLLLDRILDRLKAGQENLDIICWALRLGHPHRAGPDDPRSPRHQQPPTCTSIRFSFISNNQKRPSIGLDACAYSFRGMRPAKIRQPARLAGIDASPTPSASGSWAWAMPVLSSTPSQPSSIATVTSLAVPTPASTMTG